MSSLPNPTSTPVLLSTPIPNSAGKRHRHKRSAAISGDFDAMGLGLFSPPRPSSATSRKPSIPDFDIDKHYQFNNEVDFSDKAKNLDFSFPNTAPSSTPVHSTSVPSPRNSIGFVSPPKKLSHHQSFNSLNSPIRLGRKSHSVHLAPKTKFFLTEETQLNNENVPDAVIDLDEVLNANLHIGDSTSNSNNSSTNNLPQSSNHGHSKSDLTMVAPFEMYPDENENIQLASPYFKSYPSPFISSPLSTSNNPLFQQPIQEQELITDELEEEEEEEENGIQSRHSVFVEDEVDAADEIQRSSGVLSASASASDIEQEMFPNPQTALVGLYSNDSANSSCSSLRSGSTAARHISNSGIEKTFSNDSANIYLIPSIHTPTSTNNNYNTSSNGNNGNNVAGNGKRTGAKATRYQSFYDQSYKISNALKVSSTESVNIVRTTSNDSGGSIFPKEVRILGHSSSLPSLKTVSNKRSNQKLRFNEIRITSNGSSTSSNGQARKLSPPIQVRSKAPSTNQNTSTTTTSNTPPKSNVILGGILPVAPVTMSKNVSNSPISINSEVSSTIISSNATIQSTEHSSLHEQQTSSFSSKDSEQHTITDTMIAPQIVISTENEKKSLESQNHPQFHHLDYYHSQTQQKQTNLPQQRKLSPIIVSKASFDELSISSHTNPVDAVAKGDSNRSNSSPSKKTEPTSAISPVSATFPISGASATVETQSKFNTHNNLSPTKRSANSSRRPLSPQEETFLKQTQIPLFQSQTQVKPKSSEREQESYSTTYSPNASSRSRQSQHQPETSKQSKHRPTPLQQPPLTNNHLQNHSPSYSHRKSKSVTISTGQENENDDLLSLKSSRSKRNSRFINWLKRK